MLIPAETERKKMKRILILDTQDRQLDPLVRSFRSILPQCAIEVVFETKRVLKQIRQKILADLIAVDYDLGDGKLGGKRIIEEIRELNENVPIIAIAARGSVELAAEAVTAGATDLLVKGDRLEERVATLIGKMRKVTRLINHNRNLRRQNQELEESVRQDYEIIGQSTQMLKVLERVERVAAIPRPVLIIGERGSGKELIARAIHKAGGNHERPLVTVNCAAFSDNLLESELFGHEKGSFTSADSVARGKFEQADGGTLFLDEIGHMSLAFQQKILRAVEQKVITRVGGATEIAVRVRIIAATNADLEKKMSEGEFLRDLYDRLSFEVLHVPPLRERLEDIDLLAQTFLARFMREIPTLQGKHLSRSGLDALRSYSFPGNVRELKNIIERAAYRDTTDEITPEDIGLHPELSQLSEELSGDFKEAVEAFEKRLISNALKNAGDNQASAARSLGLSYHQFRYHLRKMAQE